MLMDRRAFLTLKKQPFAKPGRAEIPGRDIETGLTPYSGPWTGAEVAHLLKRTQFGAPWPVINNFKALTPDAAVDLLLTLPAIPPAPPLKDYDNSDLPAGDPDLAIATGETWVNTFSPDGTVNSRRMNAVRSWWIGLMLNQDQSILEKMTLFWHNHFTTEANEYGRGIFGYRYIALLRANALGNFKALVRAVTIDAAMLRYLNGYLNTAGAADENYARELQELFTLGKENQPNFAEADVLAAARVLTGWALSSTTDDVSFQPNRHDTTNKQFSAFYSNTVIAGRSGATAGDEELDELLDMIFAKEVEVSEFMVRKLYRWFCYYTIDASTETNVIKPLAQLFRDSNWEIKPVLATLLKSEHFFDPLNQGCLIKSPVEFLVGLCREFPVGLPPSSDYANSYILWNYIRNEAANLQQNLFDPPSVSGWAAYYQIPSFYEIWISSDTLPRRNLFSDTLIGIGYMQNGNTLQIDAVAFTRQLSNPADPNQLILDALTVLYRVPLSDQSRQLIKQQLLLGSQTQDYYWSNAWNAYLANPGDMTAYTIVNNRLKDLYKYLMNLAEYQLA